MIMCIDSGISEMKSQKVSWAAEAWGISSIGQRLDRVNQIGELDRVLDEEDGHVVADEVEVTLFGVELDGEAANVADGVGRTARTDDRRESHEHRRLDRRVLQEPGTGVLAHRLVDLEVAVGPAPRAWTTRSGMRSWSKWVSLLAEVEIFHDGGTA
jgi:hypothetical protein